ncbi:uncharacterized protein METZ01_LOCUS484190, partial [marine metagenome]
MLASKIVHDAEEALAAGEPHRSLHLLAHVLQYIPEHLRARTIRAMTWLALGHQDEAAEDAALVMSIDLLNVDAMLVEAKLAEARGDLHQSHVLIARAASISPGHNGVRQSMADSIAMLIHDHSMLGFSYQSLNWPDLAEREFRLALEKDVARVDLRIAMAEAIWQQGRYDEARP